MKPKIDAFIKQTTVEQPEREQPNAAQLMQQSMDMASLKSETSLQRQSGSRIKTEKVHFRQYQGIRICQLYERLGFKG